MKKIILLTLFISIRSYAFAQHLDSILINKHYYPAPTLANLIIMANSKTTDWEQQMKKFNLPTHRLEGTGEVFENGTSSTLYAVFKQPKQTTIVWGIDKGKLPIHILDSISDDLNPFYIEQQNNINYYRFEILGEQYVVGINRKDNEEIIKIIKHYPSTGRTIEYSVDSIGEFPDGEYTSSSGMMFLDDEWTKITFLGMPFKGDHSFNITKSDVGSFSGNAANGMVLFFDILSSKGIKGSIIVSNEYNRLIFYTPTDSYAMQLRY